MSLATDLGLGQPMEHVLRETILALRLGERLGLEESDREAVYYTALLAWVGCHADAHEQAKWFGDDIALKADSYEVDMTGMRETAFVLRHLGAGRAPLERARVALAFIAQGRGDAEAMEATHCLVAGQLAARLGFGDEVREALQQAFERWDGKGRPAGLSGEEIVRPMRIVQLADVVEVFHRTGGVEAAISVARRRSGTQFDPVVASTFCDAATTLLEELETATGWEAVIAEEPALAPMLSGERLDAALEAIADFADLKSPYTIGHSRSVADLADEAARIFGLPEPDAQAVRRAGLVHDLGRLGVSNAIWDKPAALTQSERERVRLHPYLTERILASSPALASLGAIAVQHHERLDGSGYPRGLSGTALTPAGRILAAADCYQARTEPRPHRAAMPTDEAAASVREEVRAGRLDGDAVDAVLRAAGHRVRRRGDWPAGLTPREVEVLGLVARGLSNREIAERLVISRKTAGNHIEHIYTKTGVSNRAQASLYAVHHGLADSQADATDQRRARPATER